MAFLRTLRICALPLLLTGACGDSSGSGGKADAGGVGPDARGTGGSCATTNDCLPGGFCDPASTICVGALACSNHDDCGGAAYCTSTGACVHSQTGAPCDGDQNCNSDSACTQGYCGCGGDFIGASSVPANVLIALDRSDSMVTYEVPGTNPTMNRWEVAQAAIATLLSEYGDQVRFGLKLWPGDNEACDQGGSCSPGAVFVDPGDGTAGDISGVLGGASTCHYGTPITGAVESLLGYSGLADTTRENYVVLITDGQQQNCSGDPVAAVADLLAQDPSVKTFVIGFSGDVDANQLSDMATAGGTARPGTPVYYQADDAASLMAAFSTIAASVVSCTYALAEVPPDPSQLYVYFDRTEIARDTSHADGWDYDAATNNVTFFGATCDQLRGGQVSNLAIVYGCEIIVP